jgi:hypothetical protein
MTTHYQHNQYYMPMITHGIILVMGSRRHVVLIILAMGSHRHVVLIMLIMGSHRHVYCLYWSWVIIDM